MWNSPQWKRWKSRHSSHLIYTKQRHSRGPELSRGLSITFEASLPPPCAVCGLCQCWQCLEITRGFLRVLYFSIYLNRDFLAETQKSLSVQLSALQLFLLLVQKPKKLMKESRSCLTVKLPSDKLFYTSLGTGSSGSSLGLRKSCWQAAFSHYKWEWLSKTGLFYSFTFLLCPSKS